MSRDQTADVAALFDDLYRSYDRYWWRRDDRYSADPRAFQGQPQLALLLRLLATRPPGRALDVGAGEGTDSIRLALLGYEVDAVEASAVGAQKIEDFAKSMDVRVRVHHADATALGGSGEYDLVVCHGLLHYVGDKAALLAALQRATAPAGIHSVSLFSDATPVPRCHRVVDVYPDQRRGSGSVVEHYAGWETLGAWHEQSKPERSHPGYPAHVHSFVKLVSRKPGLD